MAPMAGITLFAILMSISSLGTGHSFGGGAGGALYYKLTGAEVSGIALHVYFLPHSARAADSRGCSQHSACSASRRTAAHTDYWLLLRPPLLSHVAPSAPTR
jgi:hypothetical protein